MNRNLLIEIRESLEFRVRVEKVENLSNELTWSFPWQYSIPSVNSRLKSKPCLMRNLTESGSTENSLEFTVRMLYVRFSKCKIEWLDSEPT